MKRIFPYIDSVSYSSSIFTIAPLFKHAVGFIPEKGESSLSILILLNKYEERINFAVTSENNGEAKNSSKNREKVRIIKRFSPCLCLEIGINY